MIRGVTAVTPTDPAENKATNVTSRQRAVEWLVRIVFATLSLYVVGLVAWHVVVDGYAWSGAMGFVFDSMQYLAWTREMGDHLLSANMFSLDPPVRNYINPGLKLSGLLYAVGIGPRWAYGVWIPLGIIALIAAVTRLVRQLTGGGWAAVAAIALALLFKLPAGDFIKGIVPKANWNATVYSGYDSWPVFWSWGYSLTAIAVALLCTGVLVYARDRSSGKAFSPLLAAIALTVSWLQPWQGSLLLGMIVLGEIVAWRVLEPDDRFPAKPRVGLVLTTCIAGVAPLAYYAVMGTIDDSWRINGLQANRYLSGVSWWTPLFVLWPLLIAAVPAVIKRPASFQDVMIRVWPPLAIAQMFAIAATGVGNTAQHALKGISIPLAILAMQGVAPLARRLQPAAAAFVSVGLIALLTIPGAAYQLKDQSHEMTPSGRGGYFISGPDAAAIDYLQDAPRSGGVVASSLSGSMVPWRTGRQTWVGHETWTPRFQSRSQFMEVLLGGALPYWNPPADPAEFASWTGAAYLIDDCYHAQVRKMNRAVTQRKSHKYLTDLSEQLKPATASVHKFGCATVYELKPAKRPTATPPSLAVYRLDWLKGRDG